jgi:uncharacterized protein YjiS (DUF1127 family)
MAIPYTALGSKQTTTPVRLGASLFNNCCAAIIAWYEREAIRASLSDMTDRELHDIGIGRGEIDYVASNRSVDPRGAVQP